MNYVGQIAGTVFGTVKELYKGLNPATLTGCIDVIVVRQPDGSFNCSPFHVRFGKLRVLHSSEKVTELSLMKKALESNSTYYSFTDVQSEGAGTSQSQEAYPYSDGELAPLQSLSPNSSSAPKSDSELELRNPELPRDSESHVQWSWGRLPEVSRSDRTDAAKSGVSVSTTAAITPSTTISTTTSTTSTIPLCEKTHFVAITTGLESDLGMVESDDALCSPPTPIIKPAPVFPTRDGLPIKEELFPSIQVICSDLETTPSLPEDVQGIKILIENEGTKATKETIEQIQDQNLEMSSSGQTSLVNKEPCRSPELKQEKQSYVKRSPHLGPTDIYLEDLSNLDADELALYFPKSDAELNGQAQTDPDSFSHALELGDATVDCSSDNLLEHPACNQTPHILLSVCGGLGDDGELSHAEKFMKHIVSYQEFAENPAILEDPNLVIQIHKKYYNWAVAAPMLLSLQAFQKTLPKGVTDSSVFIAGYTSFIARYDEQVTPFQSTVDRLMKEKMPKKGGRWWFSWRRREFSNEEHESSMQKSDTVGKHQGDSSLQRALLSLLDHRREDASSSDDESVSSGQGDTTVPDAITQKFLPTYKKSLRLSSDQIKSLNLRDGPNEVVFSVTTQYQGTCRCEATIYLWNWYDKVVISDIDGTITRSDALGHILPHLGKDWTHQGIAKLFHKIHLNGYKFLYCSARAIGMAHITKGYLECVNDQGWMLPKGPILLAPSSLFSALHREVIEKKPEVFKIACLMDIRNLFGSDRKPFHAAFGNRPSDVYAYKEVELPESRIFTVNPKGELKQELIKIHKSTYDRLVEVVELLFPPIGDDVSTSLACPEFSLFSYWRAPLPPVDFEDFA
ncbi:hypothetical protein JD844_018750 [Phrynosoma platyrhinos]|uniref:phosphatidate phosphatase n=1 Tax=Phrynosoma platyrhinos TaxID=52577 RepID=A0ABQ7SP57_PHRPL|nr:hypothetical protein JD844_018750 [Phrynosoma platyrhinos]